MTSHEVEKFIIENYPTMDMDEMVLNTGCCYYHIRYVARKNGVYKNTVSSITPVRKVCTPKDGDECELKGKRYIRHNNRWISYIRYLWEQHKGVLRKGQRLVLKDESKPITIDNIILHQKRYYETPTQKELNFVKKVCEIMGIVYDETFLTKRKGDNILAKRIICVLHKEMYEKSEGISIRQSRIGTAIGRDRTMVVYYENGHRDAYGFDKKYRMMYDKVKENL